MKCKNCGAETENGLDLCKECQNSNMTVQDGFSAESSSPEMYSLESQSEKRWKRRFDFIKEKAKIIIENYKNFKNLSTKQKIIHIVAPVLIVLFVASFMFGGGSSDSEILAQLSTYNLIPAQMSQVYGKVTVADVVDYMFKNPDIEIEKKGADAYVTISGYCRSMYGSSDYSRKASITFLVRTNSGMVMIKSDTNGCRQIMEGIAVSMAYN
ncbi:MAG: hypothetical protein ACI4I3_04160 [Acutalibacteraceae bacterium]